MKTHPSKQNTKDPKNKVMDKYFNLLNIATRKIINIVRKYKLPLYSMTSKHARLHVFSNEPGENTAS